MPRVGSDWMDWYIVVFPFSLAVVLTRDRGPTLNYRPSLLHLIHQRVTFVTLHQCNPTTTWLRRHGCFENWRTTWQLESGDKPLHLAFPQQTSSTVDGHLAIDLDPVQRGLQTATQRHFQSKSIHPGTNLINARARLQSQSLSNKQYDEVASIPFYQLYRGGRWIGRLFDYRLFWYRIHTYNTIQVIKVYLTSLHGRGTVPVER